MRAFIDQKIRAKRNHNQQLWKRAAADTEQIIAMIIERYNPDAIYQWGSLLQPTSFSSISDIDIAVEGLCSPERFFTMLGDAQMMTNFPLDLVEMKHVQPEYAQLIKTYGRCVYRKKRVLSGKIGNKQGKIDLIIGLC